ncbi:MAG TPA: type II secretion system inner membrane protein GspF [Candidatus Binataceae bacterium]|nr:type II secretion system inner membrane protein GspF [Candidatus Binataceae bacterium]
MPVFAYRGLAPNGRNVAGVIDADSARNARGKLRELGIFPTDLSEEESGARGIGARWQWLPSFNRGIKAPELALLTRQLSTLLGAGVQLTEALGTLAEQSERPHVKRILSQVRERVREGSSLADAIAVHPEIFNDLYGGMVRVGETAGALEPVLDRLADYGERQSEFIGKVRGALTYPIIMIVAGMLIMGVLVTYVIPQVATIFEQQNAVLPLMTRILIGLSNFLSNYWLLILIALVGAAAGIMFGLSTKAGRRFYDTWILRLPFIGPTMTRIACARFARTLATLLESGVQLVPALTAVKRVVSNGLLAEAVEQSRESIREGHGMGETLQRSGLFPPLLIEMIKIGERSGELEQMLHRVADNYEREVDSSLGQLTTLLGPLMTVMMGAVILIMMLSILQPILQLNQMMQ